MSSSLLPADLDDPFNADEEVSAAANVDPFDEAVPIGGVRPAVAQLKDMLMIFEPKSKEMVLRPKNSPADADELIPRLTVDIQIVDDNGAPIKFKVDKDGDQVGDDFDVPFGSGSMLPAFFLSGVVLVKQLDGLNMFCGRLIKLPAGQDKSKARSWAISDTRGLALENPKAVAQARLRHKTEATLTAEIQQAKLDFPKCIATVRARKVI